MSDHARPLNLRGRHAAALMAQAARDLGLAPEIVLVSSARRTLQTLEAFEPWNRPPSVEPLDALYLASAADLLDVLNRVPEAAASVLLVGHNPGLHDLALLLAAQSADEGALRRLMAGYPSGALAEFSVADAWSALRGGGGGLVRFLSPGDLSEAAA